MARRQGYSVRRLRSGRYQLLVRDPGSNAQIGMGSYASEADADRAGRAAVVDQQRRVWHDPRAGEIPLGQYLDEWLARNAATGEHGVRHVEDSARLARNHIKPYIGSVLLTDLTPRLVMSWLDRLTVERIAASGSKGVIPAKSYQLVRAAMADAVRRELIRTSPCTVRGAGVARSPERPLLEPEQVVAIANAIEPRWRALVLICGFAGPRFGEMAALERRDVDLLHGRIRIERAIAETSDGRFIVKEPKTEAGRRTVVLPSPLVPVLAEHLDRYVGPALDARVFTSAKGGQLRRNTYSKTWRRAVARVGLDGVHAHDLRHAAGTLAAQSGASERELMAYLGHATPDTARRYQHAAERRASELAERIGASIVLEPVAKVSELNAQPTRKRASRPKK